MNEKLEKMRNGKGFIAALDQSGGSTPKALKLYLYKFFINIYNYLTAYNVSRAPQRLFQHYWTSQ